jgi:phosphate-selective porin OprO/OprP
MTQKKRLQIACFISFCLNMFCMPSLAEQIEAEVNEKKMTLHIEADTKIKIGGRLQWDFDYFDGVHAAGLSANDIEMRRTRFYIKSVLNKNWESQLQVDLTEKEGATETADKDVYIKYNGLRKERMQLTIGKQKEPFGLEASTSSKTTLTIERAMISRSLTPDRNYGLAISAYPNKAISFKGGVFSSNAGPFAHQGQQIDPENNKTQKTLAWTGRITYAPLIETDRLIHLGLSGSMRDFAGNEYQLTNRAEVHLADKIIQSGKIQADTLMLLGLEAATVINDFSLESEYIALLIDGEPNTTISGYYIQASYLLTGEQRSYKKGQFRKIQLQSNSIAWQVLGRYSVLDAEDNNEGNRARNLTLGVNAYINPSVRLSANYIKTLVIGLATPSNHKYGNAFSLRLQYIF